MPIPSPPVGGKPYSCSFVEFDERGDYLDFQQQRRSWQKIKELSYDQREELLFVILKDVEETGNHAADYEQEDS